MLSRFDDGERTAASFEKWVCTNWALTVWFLPTGNHDLDLMESLNQKEMYMQFAYEPVEIKKLQRVPFMVVPVAHALKDCRVRSTLE